MSLKYEPSSEPLHNSQSLSRKQTDNMLQVLGLRLGVHGLGLGLVFTV